VRDILDGCSTFRTTTLWEAHKRLQYVDDRIPMKGLQLLAISLAHGMPFEEHTLQIKPSNVRR
jgi:hypothetical protein